MAVIKDKTLRVYLSVLPKNYEDHVSLYHIEKLTGFYKPTVISHLNEMVKNGWIETVRIRGTNKDNIGYRLTKLGEDLLDNLRKGSIDNDE